MKLISVLGFSPYAEVRYCFGKRCSSPTEQVQIAILELFKEELEKYDDIEIIVLGTKESKERNWKPEDKGLKKKLEKFGYSYRFVEIPKGQNETELWEFFKQLMEEIKIKKDEVIWVDVTHGFRSQPILLLSMLKYYESLGYGRIEKILYGFYNPPKTGKPPQNKEPQEKGSIFDITVFNDFTKLAQDVLIYKLSGRAYFTHFTGELRNQLRERVAAFDGYANALKRLTWTILFPNVNFLPQAIENVLTLGTEVKQQLKNVNDPRVAAFSILFEELHREFQDWNPQTYYTHAVEWSLRRNLYQQAITFLTEGLITMFMRALNEDEKDRDKRENVSKSLQHGPIKVPKELNDALSYYKDELVPLRNRVQHAYTGTTDKPISEKNLKELLEKGIKHLRELENVYRK